jgi:hypothetical protein
VTVVYIAGPFRAKPDPLNQWQQWENIRASAALALEVWQLGAAALCPHLNTAFFQGAAPDAVWLDGDLELLGRCDAVLMAPRWEFSAGACEERRIANASGVPIFYDIATLAGWLRMMKGRVTP